MFRIIRTLVYVVLSILASTEDALAETISEPPVTATTTEEVISACEKLNNFIGVYGLDAHDFALTLEECNDERDVNATTNGTIALLNVYDAIKGEQCNLTTEMENRLIECVNTVNGFVPPLNSTMAKKHFGFNNTASIRFRNQECINSAKVRTCVEEAFQKITLTVEQLGCKTSIMRGFNITAKQCPSIDGKPTPDSGVKSLPSDLLIFGTAVMLAKLTVLYQY